MKRHGPLFWLRVALAPLLVWGLYLLKANVYFRLYPAVMVAIFLTLFTVSLFRTPLVERFARAMGETLDDRGVAYCRKVTVAWCLFLAANLAVTVGSVFASREFWVLWNGCIAYVLMGLMFLGEFCIRKRVKNG